MEDARRREIALFRYALIRPLLDDRLSSAERGRLVADLAARPQPGPEGGWVQVARPTLYRWLKAYRDGGFAALVPAARSVVPVSDAELLDLAVRLKREAPARTAAHICELIAAEFAARDEARRVPTARTLQRHFARLGLGRRSGGHADKTFGRFEAPRPNDRWTGDALHGPQVAGRKAYLFAFIDDHARLLTGYRWGRAEDSLRLEAALRRGLAARGVPAQLYVDNGSAFVSEQLARTCAVLGIQLSHSKPGEAAGRGKIERFFRTVRGQFLVEVDARGIADLDELNRLFIAWVEQRYHRRVHSETDQTPLERFMAAGIPDVPSPALLREAFLWSATRTVTKTATVSLAGNRYETDPALVGRKVECVFDPFDLSHVEVRYNGQSFGMAVPHEIGDRVHPKAAGRTDVDEHQAQTPPPVGIDYLALVEAEHREANNASINYADLPQAETTPRSDAEHDPSPARKAWHEPPLPLDPDGDAERPENGDGHDGDAPAGVAP